MVSNSHKIFIDSSTHKKSFTNQWSTTDFVTYTTATNIFAHAGGIKEKNTLMSKGHGTKIYHWLLMKIVS